MKLKPTIKGMNNLAKDTKVEEKKAPEKSKKTSNKKDKPTFSDVYKPMFEPIRFLAKEAHSAKDPTKVVKTYIELSVKRLDDDEALPHVWIQAYQESEFYTGYLKGKSIQLPLEMLYDLMDNLNEIDQKCNELGIE